MKNRFVIPVIVSAMSLFSCGPAAYVSAPVGSIPLRKNLEMDVHGSYITLLTTDSITHSGELIGIRNDTIVILSDNVNIMLLNRLSLIARNRVSSARIIVHLPNNYRVGGGIAMGLSGAVIFHTGGYGSAPLAMGLWGLAFNGIGLASAQGTEDMKVNYFDWSEGWEKVMIYSRFPKEIPSTISLEELQPRNVNDK